jgi:ribosomal protein S18 acetylase RimI-like enzyme
MARQGGYEVSQTWPRPNVQAVIETEHDNASALALYGAIGFVEEKRIPGFYMSGKDA